MILQILLHLFFMLARKLWDGACEMTNLTISAFVVRSKSPLLIIIRVPTNVTNFKTRNYGIQVFNSLVF